MLHLLAQMQNLRFELLRIEFSIIEKSHARDQERLGLNVIDNFEPAHALGVDLMQAVGKPANTQNLRARPYRIKIDG